MARYGELPPPVGLDPHSVPMRWVENDPTGPLYDLLAEAGGATGGGGARKPQQRWSKADVAAADDVPEWARDDVVPSAAGGAEATAVSPTSWRAKEAAAAGTGTDKAADNEMDVLTRLVGLDLDGHDERDLPAAPPGATAVQQEQVGEDAWSYKDPQGDVQGPFTRADICDWYEGGYFPGALPIRPVAMKTAAFVPLATLLPLWAQGRSGLELYGQSPAAMQAPMQQKQPPQQQPSSSSGAGGGSALLEQMLQSGGGGPLRTLADIEAAAMAQATRSSSMAPHAAMQQQQQQQQPPSMRTLADIEAAAMASAGGGGGGGGGAWEAMMTQQGVPMEMLRGAPLGVDPRLLAQGGMHPGLVQAGMHPQQQQQRMQHQQQAAAHAHHQHQAALAAQHRHQEALWLQQQQQQQAQMQEQQQQQAQFAAEAAAQKHKQAAMAQQTPPWAQEGGPGGPSSLQQIQAEEVAREAAQRREKASVAKAAAGGGSMGGAWGAAMAAPVAATPSAAPAKSLVEIQREEAAAAARSQQQALATAALSPHPKAASPNGPWAAAGHLKPPTMPAPPPVAPQAPQRSLRDIQNEQLRQAPTPAPYNVGQGGSGGGGGAAWLQRGAAVPAQKAVASPAEEEMFWGDYGASAAQPAGSQFPGLAPTAAPGGTQLQVCRLLLHAHQP